MADDCLTFSQLFARQDLNATNPQKLKIKYSVGKFNGYKMKILVANVLQTDKYLQGYLESNTPKIGFLKLWSGEKKLGRIGSVTSYREHVAMPYEKNSKI